MSYPRLILKPNRDVAVRQRHPWLFSGAVSRLDESAPDGGLIDVVTASGEWLARGYLNRRSQIIARLLVWDEEEDIDESFWRARLQRASAARSGLCANADTTAYRLVNAESDGMPGLIVDRYGDWLVLQILTLGIERCKSDIVHLLSEIFSDVCGIYERSDVEVREKEGLVAVSGQLWGEELQGPVEISENGFRFLVDIGQGHKTGFYLDQRENRGRVPAYSKGGEVLNAFSYTGAFSVYALAGGASHVVNVDTSSEALTLAQTHVALNGFDNSRVTNTLGDVFAQLRAYRATGRQFDLIILDPPRFAASRSHIQKASRGYKDINWIACQILRPGGVLFTFSCSGAVSSDLFQKIVFGAALDAGRDVQIIGRLSQASDHPVALTFPEGEYLKGLICRVW